MLINRFTSLALVPAVLKPFLFKISFSSTILRLFRSLVTEAIQIFLVVVVLFVFLLYCDNTRKYVVRTALFALHLTVSVHSRIVVSSYRRAISCRCNIFGISQSNIIKTKLNRQKYFRQKYHDLERIIT